ncbi:hypothetical protein [Lysinibacillus pakistanensis]|uniref:Uncharacterized protein n=1 Tax=Lysinibacillus pakistanensis TaxID=759811 RepID=A0ABX6D965_9BACI|nr:hypothetical protein GDS87_10335 [Lysinibacillus pakistanensis]
MNGINKFRVRRWLNVHAENDIIVTSKHYKRLGEIGLIKIIIMGSYKGKKISFDPELFEILPSFPSVDAKSLAKLAQDFSEMLRDNYERGNKKPTHYI